MSVYYFENKSTLVLSGPNLDIHCTKFMESVSGEIIDSLDALEFVLCGINKDVCILKDMLRGASIYQIPSSELDESFILEIRLHKQVNTSFVDRLFERLDVVLRTVLGPNVCNGISGCFSFVYEGGVPEIYTRSAIAKTQLKDGLELEDYDFGDDEMHFLLPNNDDALKKITISDHAFRKEDVNLSSFRLCDLVFDGGYASYVKNLN